MSKLQEAINQILKKADQNRGKFPKTIVMSSLDRDLVLEEAERHGNKLEIKNLKIMGVKVEIADG